MSRVRVAAAVNARPTAWQVASAFAAVYVFWGATYLAIRFAVETLPPFLMAGSRYLVAGIVLYGITRTRGAAPATARHWRSAAMLGGLMLLGGNGLVSWAEQYVDSGYASLLIATIPLWVAGLGLTLRLDRRLNAMTLTGIVLGFLGVVALVATREPTGRLGSLGAVALIAAAVSWSVGTLLQPRLVQPEDLLQAAGLQMLAGGLLLMLVGAASGETARIDPAGISLRSILALAYLVVFGTLVAFTAYVWLLRHVPASRVATYAYVNPVIAVALGAMMADERVTLPLLGAGAIIVLGVALTLASRSKPPAAAAEPAPANA